MIEEFRELLRCYDSIHSTNSPLRKEIDLWRKRFISHENEKVQAHFMATPCTHFLNQTPEHILERLRKEYHEQI